MATEATLKKVKAAIRITHTALDDEIDSDIEACLADLRIHGIQEPAEADPLIYNAIKLYCKANYTDDTAKAEAYRKSYDSLRDSLKMAEGYGWEKEAGADE